MLQTGRLSDIGRRVHEVGLSRVEERSAQGPWLETRSSNEMIVENVE